MIYRKMLHTTFESFTGGSKDKLASDVEEYFGRIAAGPHSFFIVEKIYSKGLEYGVVLGREADDAKKTYIFEIDLNKGDAMDNMRANVPHAQSYATDESGILERDGFELIWENKKHG